MNKVRTRFAPSPTGYLHIGGLRTALYGFLYAKKAGGDFILRIEDTDTNRYVEGAVGVIYDTLKDAGITYDEGPDVGGEYGPYVQSERKQIYIDYAHKLVELGGAYYCFCDKERLESLTDEHGNRRYDGHCLNLTKEEIKAKLDAGVPYVIRQKIPKIEGACSYNDMVFGEISVDYKDIEDGILLKSDGMPTYNFANVIDDHFMKINYVMRGIEYLSSTPKYNLLYDSFGWERPNYIHMTPIMKNAQEKLSKRHGDASYQDFINKGYVKEAIVNYIALLGWAPKDNREKMNMEELIESFSLDGLSKSPSIFDEQKMKWLSGEYIKEMTDEEFLEKADRFFAESKVYGKYDMLKIAKLLKTRIEIYSEIPEKINFLEEFDEYDLSLFEHKKSKCDQVFAKEILPKISVLFESLKDFSNDGLYNALSEFSEVNGYKKAGVLWAVRIAISGKDVTPGGATELAEILGKEKVLKRIDFSLKLLERV